jgi:hypothetical protein
VLTAQLHHRSQVKGAVEAPSKRQEILSREEEELNPQIGKSLKKNAKKAKKLAKKSQAVEDEEASMAPYDFGSDFTHVASGEYRFFLAHFGFHR